MVECKRLQNSEDRLKILVLAPNYIKKVNWGHQLFRNEIARQHDVVFHGGGHELHGVAMVSKLVDKYGPFDVITLGENPRHFGFYKGLADIDILKVCFVGDYFAGKEVNYNRLIKMHKVDVVFLASTDCLHRFRKSQHEGILPPTIESYFMPWYVDTNLYKPGNPLIARDYDVMCVYGLMDGVYPKRRPLQQLIKEMRCSTLVGHWTHGRIRHQRYIDAICRSKIFVSANGIHNEVTMKYTECMACATLFMTDKPRDADELGFVDDENIVFYSDFEDMQMKVKFYLDNPTERSRIAWNGYRHVRHHLSMTLGVQKMTDILTKKLQNFARQRNHSTQ